MIGVDEPGAWRVVVKAGLDSMPATRRQTLELLYDWHDAATTTDVATELGLPTPSARRVLEDLTAHGLIERESQGQGKPDLWRIEPWAAQQLHAATFSGNSEHSLLNKHQHTYDDFPEKVGEPS